jgi:peptidoglycan L-alanyl-D-glutamate endopeptidase CwlK
MPVLSARSLALCGGVHPDLVRVVKRAIEITPVDFKVECGVRTMAEQKKLVAKGASKTLKSRHVPENNKCGVSCAIDLTALVGGKSSWHWPLYHEIAKAVFQAAKEEKVTIRWGGNWKQTYTQKLASFADGPHFELLTAVYP